MGTVLAMELRKAFGGRWFKVSLLLGMVFALLGAAETLTIYGQSAFLADGSSYTFPTSTSCFATWLGVGAWGEGGAYNLFFYGILFVAPLAYSWSSIAETESGYSGEIISRCSRSTYYFSKLCAAFLSAAAVVAAALLANLIAVACFFPAYQPNSYDNLYSCIYSSDALSHEFYSNPVLFVTLRTLFDSVLCGAWACVVLSLGWFIRNRVITFVIPYIALLGIEYFNHYFFASLGPIYFVEFSPFQILRGWSYAYVHDPVVSCCVVAVLGCVALLLTALKVKRDVL